MTDDEKLEHAEAIKHALGMGYGPPMEGEEGWVPPVRWRRSGTVMFSPGTETFSDALVRAGIAEPVADEDFDATAQAIMDELREKKERRMAEELAKQRAKAAEPKPSTDPWAVIGKAEDDGERIMDITRNFG